MVAIDSPGSIGPARPEGSGIGRTAPLHFELHTDESVPERTALATLVDAVLPVLQTTGVLETKRCYFDRLVVAKQDRLRLSFADGEASAEVMALLAARFDAQGRPRPYRVIHSPGSMLADLVAGPMAAEVFERFSRRAAPLLFGWIEEIAAGNRKLPSIAFDLLAIQILSREHPRASDRTRPAFPRAFLTYRSHADGFFIMARKPDAARAAVEARYAQIAASSQARFRALQHAINTDALSPDLAQWRAVMADLLNEAREAIDGGAIYFSAGTGYMGDQNDLSESEFHQKIQSSSGFQSFMRVNPAFLSTRLSMGMLYLSLRRLGLPILDRYFLCHTVARSVEEIYGLDPVAELQNFLVDSLTPKWRGGSLLRPLVRFGVRFLPKL